MSSRLWFVSLSIAGHLAVGFAIYATNTWGLERLTPSRGPGLALGILSTPAPAGEAPAAKDTTRRNPKRPKVNQTVQLVKATESPDVGPAIGDGSGQGSGGGAGSGTGTEPAGGCAFPPCEDKVVIEQPKIEIPKPKLAVKRLSPHELGNLRTGGRDDIQPPEHVKRQMIDDDRLRSTGTLEVCVNEGGAVSSVRVLASTRYPGYDAALVAAVRGWRYRPHATAGEPVSVCSTVTFIYSIK